MRDVFESIATIIGSIVVIAIVVIIAPLITFGCGFLAGLILQFFIGDAVVNGLNLLFNTTRFEPNMLPIACGALATIGSFFKTTISSKSND